MSSFYEDTEFEKRRLLITGLAPLSRLLAQQGEMVHEHKTFRTMYTEHIT
jgi:hypothetical protein